MEWIIGQEPALLHRPPCVIGNFNTINRWQFLGLEKVSTTSGSHNFMSQKMLLSNRVSTYNWRRNVPNDKRCLNSCFLHELVRLHN